MKNECLSIEEPKSHCEHRPHREKQEKADPGVTKGGENGETENTKISDGADEASAARNPKAISTISLRDLAVSLIVSSKCLRTNSQLPKENTLSRRNFIPSKHSSASLEARTENASYCSA